MDSNLYQMFGLASGASDLDIKLSFERSKRALQARAREHPSEQIRLAVQLQELNSAYLTLTNPARRRAYDESLYARAVSAHGAPGLRSERAFFKQFVTYGGLPLLVIAGLALVLTFFHGTRPAEQAAPQPVPKSRTVEVARVDRAMPAGAQRDAARSTTPAAAARDRVRDRDGKAAVSGARNLGDDATAPRDAGEKRTEPLAPEPAQPAEADARADAAAGEPGGDETH